jgi:hypothetical protein
VVTSGIGFLLLRPDVSARNSTNIKAHQKNVWGFAWSESDISWEYVRDRGQIRN